ncbi:MAG: response regulator [Proteobacteria bacterium]|nr:response regulator [Pseudomonadota bacterium]MBU1058788.1 response regulator [Pseudomonadota bacterium]
MKPSPSHKILIVDDEAIVREILVEFLEVLGYQADQLEDGASGLKAMNSGNYTIAFADIRMPGIDGIEFVKCLKKNRPEIPVIIITGHGTEDTCKEAMDAGAFAFFQKPFHFIEIKEVMENIKLLPHFDSTI